MPPFFYKGYDAKDMTKDELYFIFVAASAQTICGFDCRSYRPYLCDDFP